MLGQSTHGWKVNFCKFTNETRNGIEEATAESRQAYLAAVNGPCAGGGYELALATRPHRHGRRRQHVGVAARGAAARRAARAPAGSPGSSTSATCAATAPTSSARSRRASRASGRWSGGWWTRWCRAPGSRRRSPARAAELAAAQRPPGDGAAGIALTPLERTIDGDRIAYRHVTLHDRPRARRRRDHRGGPDGAAARATSPRSTRRARRSGRSRWRASSTT